MNPALRGDLFCSSSRWRLRLGRRCHSLCWRRRGIRVIFAMMIIVVIVMMVFVMLVLARIMPLAMQDVLVLRDTFEVRLELALALPLRQRTELHVDVTASHAWILVHVPHV